MGQIHPYNTAGTYTVHYQIAGGNGCAAVDATASVAVNALPVFAVPTKQILPVMRLTMVQSQYRQPEEVVLIPSLLTMGGVFNQPQLATSGFLQASRPIYLIK